MIFAILVVFFSGLTLYWYWKSKTNDSKHSPPGPARLSFFGNILQIGRLKHKPTYEMFEILSQQYGPVMSLRVGILEHLIVNDYQTMKEILCSELWRNRHFDEYLSERSFKKSLGLIFANGDGWKDIRKFSIKTLKDFGFGKQKSMEAFLNEEIIDLTERLNKSIEKNCANTIVCMKQFFTVSVLNILWTMLAGSRFAPDDKRLANLLSYMNQANRVNTLGNNAVQAFPVLRHFYQFTSWGQTRIKFLKEFHRFFQDILNERREEGFYKEGQRDFIDVFLKEIDNNKHDNSVNNYYTDEQFIIVCLDLFIAGAETTANSLEFAVLYMILNPHVQIKVRAEIDKIVGTSRLPSALDREHMPYTEATLLEVQRMANVLPLIIRAAKEDTKVGSYDIDKGTLAVLNINSMHYNKDMWGDPHTFRPERFLDENHMNIINASKILPFGLGKRVCLGEQLAKATMFSFFTTLIQCYTFEKSPLHSTPCEIPMNGFTLSPHPFHVLVKQM